MLTEIQKYFQEINLFFLLNSVMLISGFAETHPYQWHTNREPEIPRKLDRTDLHSGFHLHMVPEAWQRRGKEALAG